MKKRILTLFLAIIMCFAQGLTMVGCNVIDGNKEFTITFDANAEDAVLVSGELVQTVSSADQLVEPVFTREGYRFVGWTSSIQNLKSTRTVKAIWEVYYTVTFDAGLGATESGQTTVEVLVSGNEKLVPPVFVRTGYNLSWDTDLQTVNKTCTVNAVWTPKKYTIEFLDTDGTATDVENKVVDYDSTLEDLPYLSRKLIGGFIYRFVGWKDKSGVPLVNGMVWKYTEDISVYANWVQDEFLIDYDLAGGNPIQNPDSYSSSYETTIENPTRTGYDFAGWTGTGIEDKVMNLVIPQGSTGHKQFTATWTPKTYTITLDAGNGNLVGETTKEVTFDCAVGELEIPTLLGHDFLGWKHVETNTNVNSEYVWKIDSTDIVLTAEWQAKTYEFTLDIGQASLVGSKVKSVTFGQSFGEIEVPVNEDYDLIFDYWTYGETDTVFTAKTVLNFEPNNLVLVAHYRLKYNYTVSFSLTSVVRKLDVPCALKTLGNLQLDGKTLEEYTIVIKEGETFADHGITTLPTVDPIEPKGMDEYSFGGYWKYYIGDNKLHKINTDTVFNEESLPGASATGEVKLIPHCRAHWTPSY